MAVVKHGVSAETQNRMIIDAGAIYFGFLDADNPGTLLGATRGGNVFEATRTIRRMEVDGARGPVKGMRRLESVEAIIKANMLELTAENFRRAIAGAIYTSGTTTVTAEANGDGDGAQKTLQLGMLIEDCEAAWDEMAVGEVTSEVDAGESQVGTNCVKLTVGTDFAATVIATHDAASLDGDKLILYDKINLRIKVNKAVTAGQLQMILGETAEGVAPDATVNIPALAADTWYNLKIAADLSGCAGLTIDSVGIQQSEDIGAIIIYIDDWRACAEDIEENSETITLAAAAQTRGTEYTMDYDHGIIQFVTAPPDGDAVVATYKHVMGDAVIGGETTEANLAIIKSTAYIDNVTIVGTISDPDLPGTTQPVIIQIQNALCDTPLSLSMAPKDEAVPEVTFTAHYLPTALDTEPWKIEYPSD